MTITTIMTADKNGTELVEFARQTADRLVHSNLTRSQIRGIFAEARKLEAMWDTHPEDAQRRLNMLKPKLDYQAARKKEVGLLKDVLSKAIDEINQAGAQEERDRRFHVFMDLFEAILAYHRALGGRD